MTSPASNGQLRYATSNGIGAHQTTPQRKTQPNGGGVECNGKGPSSEDKEEERSARQSLIILAAIFFTSLFAMIYVYAMFPELDE